MAIRNLRYGDDEILTKRAREIEVIDDKLKTLAQDMFKKSDCLSQSSTASSS